MAAPNGISESFFVLTKLYHDLGSKFNKFTKGKQIIVAREFAGGLAMLLWADYVKKRAPNSNAFVVSDSGIFLDFKALDTNEN